MRVLLCNKYFYLRGGAERALFDLERALVELGHRVIPFGMQHPDNLERYPAEDFVSEVVYDRARPSLSTLRAVSRFFGSSEVRRKVSALLDRHRPDLAILNNVYHQLGPSLILELHRRKVPMVMLLHDYKVTCPAYTLFREGKECRECSGRRFFQAARHGCGGSRARGLLLAAESHVQWGLLQSYDKVTRFLAPSRFLIDTVRSMGFPFEIDLFPNAVEAAAEPADPGAHRAVGYAGRLSAEKGLDVVLDAARRLSDVPIRIVGDGPLRADIERRVQEAGLSNVSVLGPLPHDRLMQELRSWRAALVPSHWPENAPFSVLEPMAQGVPVVASRVGGIPELIAEGGVLLPPGDPEALARAVRLLDQDAELTRSLGRKGWETIRSQGGHARYAERLERVLAGGAGV